LGAVAQCGLQSVITSAIINTNINMK
jgi:hypothetical protein